MFLFWMNRQEIFHHCRSGNKKNAREFPGAVISISHDRKYIEEVCDKIYQLNPNGLQLIGD